MRRVLRWLLILVGIVVAAALALIAYVFFASSRLMARTYIVQVPAVTVPSDANSLARGKYLFEKVALCCHGANLTGGGGPPPGASNITPVGIGDWSEQDFFVALRTHKRPNGSEISESMPRTYGEMSDDDLRRILGYLRSVPAAGQKTANQQRTGG